MLTDFNISNLNDIIIPARKIFGIILEHFQLYYRIHIFSSLKISNKNTFKNILEI